MAEKVPIIKHTADYRGDHSKDFRVPVMVDPDTTVDELIERLECSDAMNQETFEISIPEDPA